MPKTKACASSLAEHLRERLSSPIRTHSIAPERITERSSAKSLARHSKEQADSSGAGVAASKEIFKNRFSPTKVTVSESSLLLLEELKSVVLSTRHRKWVALFLVFGGKVLHAVALDESLTGAQHSNIWLAMRIGIEANSITASKKKYQKTPTKFLFLPLSGNECIS